MEYQDSEQEAGMASEAVAANYMINKRSDLSRAITGDELLNRLQPRIEGLFK